VRSRLVVCLIALAVLGAACTSGAAVTTTTSSSTTTTTVATHPAPTIAVDLSATPAGWVPVAYGDAQISVPSSFSVYYPGMNECGFVHSPGAVFVGPVVGGPNWCPAPVQPGGSTAVTLLPLGPLPEDFVHLAHIDIHGVTVLVLPSGRGDSYLVPALGVRLSGQGPLLTRVLRTLTRSPRTVALVSVPALAIPSGWHAVTFGGLSFDAPRSWMVVLTAITGRDVGWACNTSGPAVSGLAFRRAEVVLSSDRQPFPVIANCPLMQQFQQQFQQPNNGIELDAGNIMNFPVPVTFTKRCLDIHGLTACPATSLTYSILFLKVTVPGRATPVIVSIGLAGNGMVAGTILYSLRAA
jgi:hypothetical protein